jgi:hypothetical protein
LREQSIFPHELVIERGKGTHRSASIVIEISLILAAVKV